MNRKNGSISFVSPAKESKQFEQHTLKVSKFSIPLFIQKDEMFKNGDFTRNENSSELFEILQNTQAGMPASKTFNSMPSPDKKKDW